MSGPKVDIAQLREQEKQRLIRQRMVRKALCERLNLKIKECTTLLGLNSNSDKLIEQYVEQLKELSNIIATGNEKLDHEEFKLKIEALEKEFEANISSYKTQIEAEKENRAKLKEFKKQEKSLTSFKRIEVDLSKHNPNDTKFEKLTNIVNAFQSDIKAFIADTEMTSNKKNLALSIHKELMSIVNSEIDERKKRIRIQNLYKEFDDVRVNAEKEKTEMREAYELYLTECFDTNKDVLKLSDFSSKQEIFKAIDISKRDAEASLSKEYIKRQINEVMEKHGYDVVRSDLLSKTNNSGQVLYGVNNTTAINVFVSNENQVTMRVVGIGFNEDLTVEEDEELFQQQCAFCTLHPQITKELQMRGVILQTVKHLKEDKKYNKKIKVREKDETLSVSRAKKDLKRRELKSMKRE